MLCILYCWRRSPRLKRSSSWKFCYIKLNSSTWDILIVDFFIMKIKRAQVECCDYTDCRVWLKWSLVQVIWSITWNLQINQCYIVTTTIEVLECGEHWKVCHSQCTLFTFNYPLGIWSLQVSSIWSTFLHWINWCKSYDYCMQNRWVIDVFTRLLNMNTL